MPETAGRRRAPRLRVEVRDQLGRPARVRGLAAWLAHVAPARARGSIAVALVSDARIRSLNRTYRHKDYSTDVLSFAAGGSPAADDDSLGDIVIGRGVARRQARQARHTELTELKILALHGLLHLLGYDHERDNGQMRDAERRLRRKGGLPERPRSASGAGVGPRAPKK